VSVILAVLGTGFERFPPAGFLLRVPTLTGMTCVATAATVSHHLVEVVEQAAALNGDQGDHQVMDEASIHELEQG
jgi:hypothetical protein